jgi:lactoylglutathione lyase
MIRRIDATVLFVRDLDACMKFYRDIIGFEMTFSDDVSFAFRTTDQDFVVLKDSAAAEMVGADAVGKATGRVLLCAGVENVDNVYTALTAKGVAFIKPPKDQAWGRRTAYFADPEGNLWELYHLLPQ